MKDSINSKSKYNPTLDYSDGQILFKEKLERAKKHLLK